MESQHIKPGKGAAFTRARMRNLKNNSVQDKTFRGDEKIEEAYVEERKLQYQYNSSGMYNFMDQETYEEIAIAEEDMGKQTKFLKDNLEITAYYYKGVVLYVALPNFIEVKIVHSEPGVKGDTAKSGTKTAEIETGANIQVPLFVNEGDIIKVDTRSGGYIERIS
jgi:elongation factor P